jgi:hypothetical protein
MDLTAPDLMALEQLTAERRAQLASQPFRGGLNTLKYYVKHIPDDFVRSINPMPALRSKPQQIMAALRREFSALLKPTSGLFALASDMAFTTIPTAFKQFKEEGPLTAIKTLLQGATLSAGGLGASALTMALLPGFGIPGFFLSNFAYDMGKKLASKLTGFKPANADEAGNAPPTPYLNPSKLPIQGLASGGGSHPEISAMTGAAAAAAPVVGSVAASAALANLPESSRQSLDAALRQAGTSLDTFTKTVGQLPNQ